MELSSELTASEDRRTPKAVDTGHPGYHEEKCQYSLSIPLMQVTRHSLTCESAPEETYETSMLRANEITSFCSVVPYNGTDIGQKPRTTAAVRAFSEPQRRAIIALLLFMYSLTKLDQYVSGIINPTSGD